LSQSGCPGHPASALRDGGKTITPAAAAGAVTIDDFAVLQLYCSIFRPELSVFRLFYCPDDKNSY
jgi:hypothetical protein